MRSYKQLDQEQRDQVYPCHKVGKSQSEIAQEIGVDPATISRELRRHQGEPGYRPYQVHQKALARRQNASKPIKMTARVIDWIEEKLCQDWSPEHISGTMKHKRFESSMSASINIFGQIST